MFAAAFVAWIVALLGDHALGGVTRLTRGSPEYRALHEAMTQAIDTVLEDMPPESREPLEGALRERFTTPPPATRDGRTRVRTGIIQAIQTQLAPLGDPGITPSGNSFFDEIGVDGAQLRDELGEVVIRCIEQVGPRLPALTPLVTQLNADNIVERVDAVLDRINQVQALASQATEPAPANSRALVQGVDLSRKTWAIAYSANVAERLTEAFLDVPTVADAESRATILAMLPHRLRNAIPHSRFPRIQVLEMIRMSQNYPNGMRSLVQAVRLAEGDSAPMMALEKVIVDLDGEDIDQVSRSDE